MHPFYNVIRKRIPLYLKRTSRPHKRMAVRHLKCVIIGDGCVGKTSLLYSYVYGAFHDDYVPTVFDNYSTLIQVDNSVYSLVLYDTAGQSDYDRLRPLSYPQTDVFLVCYSMISQPSLMNVKSIWIPEISHYCPGVPFLLIGTKLDMVDDPLILQRLNERGVKPVDYKDVLSLAKELGAKRVIETSSKTGHQIKSVFIEAVRVFLEHERDIIQKKLKHKSGCQLL